MQHRNYRVIRIIKSLKLLIEIVEFSPILIFPNHMTPYKIIYTCPSVGLLRSFAISCQVDSLQDISLIWEKYSRICYSTFQQEPDRVVGTQRRSSLGFPLAIFIFTNAWILVKCFTTVIVKLLSN
jgi:hypothetical protein